MCECARVPDSDSCRLAREQRVALRLVEADALLGRPRSNGGGVTQIPTDVVGAFTARGATMDNSCA